MADFIERHAEKIAGVLPCLDRVVITGTLPDICHAQAATSYLFNHKIRIFYYTKFAEPHRDQIRSHAEELAADHGLTIEFLRNHDVRKEDLIQEILAHRGRHGLADRRRQSYKRRLRERARLRHAPRAAKNGKRGETSKTS